MKYLTRTRKRPNLVHGFERPRLPTGREYGKRQDDRANMRQHLMQTLSEDKLSAPQNRGTESLPPDSSRRKGADILTRVNIETPATQAGSSYALLPARLLCLPGGELLVLAVLLSQRRSNGTFLRPLTFSELCRSLGFCGKTLGAHVASLRARGLVHHAELKPTAEAITKRGERYAKVRTDRASLTGCAAFRLLAGVALFTDAKGNLRVSRRYLASTIGRSTRTARRLLCELRAVGYSIPARVFTFAEKTVRSTRKKLSAISVKVSKQRFHTRAEQRKTLNGPLTEAEVEERKRKARSQLATILRQHAPA